MKRCPSCRTLCDPSRDQRCFACGGDLSATPPSPPRPVPEVLSIARRDRKSTSALFTVFAFLGGAGVVYLMILPGIPAGVKFGVGAVLGGAMLLGVWSETTGVSDRTFRVVTKGLAFFGMIIATAVCGAIGLLILLFAACSLRILR